MNYYLANIKYGKDFFGRPTHNYNVLVKANDKIEAEQKCRKYFNSKKGVEWVEVNIGITIE